MDPTEQICMYTCLNKGLPFVCSYIYTGSYTCMESHYSRDNFGVCFCCFCARKIRWILPNKYVYVYICT